jgi:cytochrome P450
MVDCTSRLQDRWAEGEAINLADEMIRLTLWIVGKVLFGADVLGEASELGEALTYTFRHFVDEMTNPVHLPQSWPTPQNRRAREAVARVDATIYRIIEERRRTGEESSDLLSVLLHAQGEDGSVSMSDRQVRDEAITLFIAGHETTATALAWSWYLLSKHPDVYARMRAEGDRVLGGRLPTIADLPNLPYTLQIFKEALRLYPPSYAFTRRAISPVQLGAYHIPRGATIVISPYTLHRRPILFPDPERFDPERFTPQQEQSIPHYAYIPFSTGSRICLGMHFALLEGHLILAALAQHVVFEFAGTRSIEPEPLLTLRPKGGVPMVVRRR